MKVIELTSVEEMMATYEVLTELYPSLTKEEYSSFSENFKSEFNVTMLNPLSNDLKVMRQSLLFSGLESISYNLNRKKPKNTKKEQKTIKYINKTISHLAFLEEKEEDLNNYRNSELFKTIWPTIKPWFEVKAEAWSMHLVTN